ncbi:uncharacterized DUF497 family protein [Devosia sp. UYZn731]|uniref:BrnT family toxin n=1 Tax=Devosia sp. UYZn731 TaxID=3156345 RepID=UPI003393A57D
MEIAGFDWNVGNLAKCQRHGVSIEDIQSLFARPHVIAEDVKHSIDEQRFLAIGRTATERPLFVAFTTRQQGGRLLVRPISARFMHAKEFKNYGR